MIAFDCPVCGTRLEFEPEQAGNRTRCPECGAPFSIPQPKKTVSFSPPIPPPLPDYPLSPPVPPPVPPLPPDVLSVPPTPPSPPPPRLPLSDTDAEVLSLLAHAYNEAREDSEASRAAGPQPPALPKRRPPPPKPKPWGCWLACGILIVLAIGAGAAYFLVDWKGPNPNLLEARRLKAESEQTLIRAHEKEMEWTDHKITAARLWGKVDKCIDSLIASAADAARKYRELDESEQEKTPGPDSQKPDTQAFDAARERFLLHHADYIRLREQAVRDMLDSDQAALDWKELRETSDRLLHEADAKYALARAENAMFDPSEMEHAPRHALKLPALYRETVLSPRNDQIQGLFTDFQFPGTDQGTLEALARKERGGRDETAEKPTSATPATPTARTAQRSSFSLPLQYTAFDSGRRASGSFSLRITRLGEEEIVVRYPVAQSPENDVSRAVSPAVSPAVSGSPHDSAEIVRGKAAWTLDSTDCLVFQVRFPEVDELLGTVQVDERTGMLRRISVRIGNASAFLQYEAMLSRYLDVLFYAGRGGFTTVEIPFSGNTHWKRTESEGFGDDAEFAVRFFSRIEWMELRFQPDSPVTTLWLDGLRFTTHAEQGEIDLRHAELMQETRRERDLMLVARRLDDLKRQKERENKETRSNNASIADNAGIANIANIAGPHRIVARVLELGGSIEVHEGGRIRRFSGNADVSRTEFDQIAGIDLANCDGLTEADLDLIGTVRELKMLNLARTGLTDTSLVKLSTLHRLESLDLSENKITFDALPHLLTTRETLRTLNLNGCHWGRLRLEPIGRFTQLRILSLDKTPIDNADLGYLVTLDKLESLSLGETRISPGATVLLGSLTALRELNVYGTQFDDTAIAEAKKTLPKVKIVKRAPAGSPAPKPTGANP